MPTTAVSAERVQAAYAALGNGDRTTIEEFWAPDMTWQVAGGTRVSGLHIGLDDFLEFVRTMGELTGGSLKADLDHILVSDDTAVILSHNTATRADDPSRTLDIDEAQYLRWSGGRIVEGRGAMFGTGTEEFERFLA